MNYWKMHSWKRRSTDDRPIHDRTVSEKISSYSLQQVLKSEHADESTFLQSYYAPTDELLLIAHQPTARGRCGQVVWDPSLGARPSTRVGMPMRNVPTIK